MSSIQILLMGNNLAELLVIRQQFEQHSSGFSYGVVTSLSEAEQQLAIQPVGSVILHSDIADEVASQGLSFFQSRCIPVLILAPVGREERVAALFQQGATDYLIQDAEGHYLKLLPSTLQKAMRAIEPQQQPDPPAVDRLSRLSEQPHLWERYQRQELLLASQQQILELMVSNGPLVEILNLLVKAIEAQTDGLRGSILLLKDQRLWHGAAPNLPASYARALQSGIEIGPQSGSCGTAAYRREPVIVMEIAEDPLWVNYRDLAQQLHLRSCWSTPIFSKTGRVLGTFAFYHSQPYAPQPEDWKLVDIATSLAALAIERQQIESSLDQSEARFRATFEQAAIGICHASIDGHLLRFNRKFCEIVGYSPLELQSLTFQEITYPDDLPDNLQQLQRLLKGYLTTYTLEKRYIRKDRTIIWLNLTVSLTRDAQGDHSYLIGVVEDITARKQAEIQLREAINALHQLNQELELRVGERTAELQKTNCQLQQAIAERQKLVSLVENSTDFISLATPSGRMTYINPAGQQLVGLEETAEIGKFTIPDFYFLEDWATLRQTLASGQDWQGEVQLRHLKTHASIPVMHSAFPIKHLQTGGIIAIASITRDITERKQAEEQLQNLSDRLSLAVTSGGIGIWDWDILNNLVLWDDRMYELYGLKRSDFANVYEAWLHAVHPDDRVEAELISLQARRGEREYNPEFRVIHADGSIHYIQAHALIQRDLLGEPLRMIGINFDVTERRQTEERLRASEAALLEAQRVAHIGNWEFDVNTQTIHWSEELFHMFGMSPNQPVPSYADCMESVHPADRPILSQLVEQALLHGTPYQLDYRIVLADGSLRYHEGRGEAIRNAHGQVVKLFGTALDISQRKQIELLLQQQLEKEQLLVSILKRIRDSLDLHAILKVTVEEVRQTIQADRILVYRLNDDGSGQVVAESMTAPWQPLLNLCFSAETLPADCFDRYIQGGIYRIEDCEQTEMADCARAFMVNLQIRAKLVVPIVQEHQRVWGLLIAHECSRPRHWENWEITLMQQLAGQLGIAIQQSDLYQQLHAELEERQRTEADLQTTNEQLHILNMELARATRLKDEFLANMSHELRTPLNAILGMSEILQELILGELNSQQQKAIATIEDSGRHLLDLINDILDLAKIEAGKLELCIETHAVQSLCLSSLGLVKQMAYHKQIQLNSQIAPDLGEIQVDERRLKQVLINLLSNAIKFTPSGGSVALEVWSQPAISQTGTQPLIYFCISDTGIGIAPENLPKLFQSFVQIDSKLNRQYDGTGLGLALVKRIVELHGGRVEVESTLNQGSRFTVILPYEPTPISSPSLPTATDRSPLQVVSPTRQDRSDTQPLILLAEDNQANVESYSNYLVSYGYRLVIAANGLEAVALALAHLPDLILMDIQMPELNGLEAIRQIRTHPPLHHTPIIALTALAMPGDQERCLSEGANEYLTKPVRLRYLVNKISELLQRQGS